MPAQKAGGLVSVLFKNVLQLGKDNAREPKNDYGSGFLKPSELSGMKN